MIEQFGALLTPVAGPVAAGGAVAVDAGEDVGGVGSGQGALLECGWSIWGDRLGTTARLICLWAAYGLVCLLFLRLHYVGHSVLLLHLSAGRAAKTVRASSRHPARPWRPGSWCATR